MDRMTAEECVELLIRLGYSAKINDEGLPTIMCSEKEMAKRKKYARLMACIGWDRSWAREGVKQ